MLALGLGACVAFPADRAESVVVSDGRYAMGTILEITLVAPDPERGRAWLDAFFVEAERVEQWTSRHREDSALSRLNAAAGRGPQPTPHELADLLTRAQSWSRETGGAFDISVGPLVALWKGASARGVAPTAPDLAVARASVGVNAFRVAPTGVEVAAGAALDLGALAKGTALDRIVALARAQGVEKGLFNFGQSSLWALGSAPGGGPWRLLLRSADGGHAGVIELRDEAASISASLGQWSEIGGRRYGHVLDPRSGRPLLRDAQVVVLDANAERAEALSTAWLVLGAEAGAERVRAVGAEGLWLGADGGRVSTPGWRDASGFEDTGRAPPDGARGGQPMEPRAAPDADTEPGRAG